MRALVLLLAGGLGLGAFWRRLRRGGDGVELGPDPAAELRAKLAASKAADAGGGSEEAPLEPGDAGNTDESGQAPIDPVARRQAVHDRARAAIDELR